MGEEVGRAATKYLGTSLRSRLKISYWKFVSPQIRLHCNWNECTEHSEGLWSIAVSSSSFVLMVTDTIQMPLTSLALYHTAPFKELQYCIIYDNSMDLTGLVQYKRPRAHCTVVQFLPPLSHATLLPDILKWFLSFVKRVARICNRRSLSLLITDWNVDICALW